MLRRSVVSLLAVAVAAVLAVPAPSAFAIPPEDTLLDRVVARLGELAPAFESNGVLAVTVIRLDRPEFASYRGSEAFKSASVVKAVWMAAALDHRGVEGAEAYATAVLYRSSNDSAGLVIDAAGGIDAVNNYAHALGMADTTAYEWNFPEDRPKRRAEGFPGPLRGNNLTTTDDLAGFWAALAYGYALGPAETAALLEWTLGPKASYEGTRLIARLPEEAGQLASFKSGWLEIGREYEIQDDETGLGGEEPGTVVTFEGGAVSTGAGLFTTRDGGRYALAVAAYDGRTWGHMTGWQEFASCVVYSVVARDPLDCTRPGDPAAVRHRVAAPSGSLDRVVVTGGAVLVEGWAADPDAWWSPTRVAVSLDGVVVGVARADPTGDGGLFAPRFRRVIPYEGGNHEVCAVALNDGSGEDTVLGCETVVVTG